MFKSKKNLICLSFSDLKINILCEKNRRKMSEINIKYLRKFLVVYFSMYEET